MSGNGIQGIWNVKHFSENGENGETFTLCGFFVDGCEPFTEQFTTLAKAQEKAQKLGNLLFALRIVRSVTHHQVVWIK